MIMKRFQFIDSNRQTILEKLGKTTRTVDVELETQIDALRDTQKKYSNVLRLARALSSHFYHVVQTQVRRIQSHTQIILKLEF